DAADGGALHARRIEHAQGIRAEIVERVVAWRRGRSAVPPRFEADDAMPLRKGPDLRLPDVERRAERSEEEHRGRLRRAVGPPGNPSGRGRSLEIRHGLVFGAVAASARARNCADTPR